MKVAGPGRAGRECCQSLRKLALGRGLMSVLMACAAATAIAAESGSIPSHEYRLRIEQPDAYRLTPTNGVSPAPASHGVSAPAPQLADKPFATLIDHAAREAALDPALVHAVIYVESRYDPAARSPKGAIGLMQVLPETAQRYGIADPGRSPTANLKAGTRYLGDLVARFDGQLDLVLAAYNAGENAVLRYGQRIPPYRETKLYVPAVLAKYREWQQPVAPPPGAGPVRMAPRIEYLPGTRLELQLSATPAQ